MTLAVADSFLQAAPSASEKELKGFLVRRLKHFGKLYPYAGYGVPEHLKTEVYTRLPEDLLLILESFHKRLGC